MFQQSDRRSRSTPLLLAAGAAGLAWWGLRKLREANLEGRSVVITGGSRGLGLLLAREFARQGCRLVICARDPEELETAKADLRRYGTDVTTFAADVRDSEKMEELIATATSTYGGVDILVNNAGIISVGPMQAVTREDIGQAMDVMFWGMVNPTFAVLPQMRRRGNGRIVNITSIGGVMRVPHLLAYNCAKSAAVGFSEGITAELVKEGVGVTTVIPGVMRIGSHLNAEFHGNAQQEFTWFSLAASLPLFSVNGERAARQIVKAVQRGDSVKVVGLPAELTSRLHRLFPCTSLAVMGLVNRFLPTAERTTSSQKGMALQRRSESSWLKRLTALGQAAARRNNELVNLDG